MLNLCGVLEKCKCFNIVCIIGYIDWEIIIYNENIIF